MRKSGLIDAGAQQLHHLSLRDFCPMRLSLNMKLVARLSVIIAVLAVPAFSAAAIAEEDSGNRYGLFGRLDHRSVYGSYWFPEPLRAPEMDVDDELRIHWVH